MNALESRSLRPLFVTVVLPAVLLLGAFYLAGTYMQAHPYNRPSISAQGETKVSKEPDLATVTLGVQTGRVKTSQEATSTLEDVMNAVLAAVKTLEIAETDVQTSGFSLYPAYDWVDGVQVSRGYEASQNVTIKVRTPSKVSDVITATTQAGANTVSGIQFMVEDKAALQEQARRESIAKANVQAEKLAEELDMSLGRLLSYGEDISGYNEASYGKGLGGGGGDMVMESMSVPTGEQEFTVRVYLQYELR